MDDRPPIRYAMAGEVSIAYGVIGEGPFDLVWVHGPAGNLEVDWESPFLVQPYERLASISRLIIFDKRGVGLSDRNVGAPTLEERMDDVRAVMDAVGSERAALIGVSEGGPMSALFAATYQSGRWRSSCTGRWHECGAISTTPMATRRRSPSCVASSLMAGERVRGPWHPQTQGRTRRLATVRRDEHIGVGRRHPPRKTCSRYRAGPRFPTSPDSGSKGWGNVRRTKERGAGHHLLRCTTWSKGRRSSFVIGLRGRRPDSREQSCRRIGGLPVCRECVCTPLGRRSQNARCRYPGR